MSDVAFPSSNTSGVRPRVAGKRERSCPVHARLHLINQEQVTPALSPLVQMPDHVFRDRTHAADALDQLHLHGGELMRRQERINASLGIR